MTRYHRWCHEFQLPRLQTFLDVGVVEQAFRRFEKNVRSICPTIVGNQIACRIVL